jgi:hypothetical protein
MDGGDDFTMFFWLKISAGISGSQPVIQITGDNGLLIEVAVENYGDLWFRLDDGTVYYVNDLSGSLIGGAWNFIAVGRRAAGEIWLSINAGTKAVASESNWSSFTSCTINLADVAGGSEYVILDQVGIIRSELAAPELAWIYNAGASRAIT